MTRAVAGTARRGSRMTRRQRPRARLYLAAWSSLLAMSWRMKPGFVIAIFAVLTADVGLVGGAALLLRYIVNRTIVGDAQAAVVGALGAAALYGVTSALWGVAGTLRLVLVEKVGLTELHQRIQLDIATLDGLWHLEDAEYLDKVTVVAQGAWQLTDGLWAAVQSIFSILQLAVLLVVLGEVSPWLLALLGFAVLPLLCDYRGTRAVKDAETASAEQQRLQEHLFDLATSPLEGKEVRVAGAAEHLARLQGEAWAAAATVRVKARVYGAVWKLGGWSAFTAAFVAGLGFVAYRARHGHAAVGDIVMTVTVAANLSQSVRIAVNRATDSAGTGRLIEPYLWLRERAAADRAGSHGTRPAPQSLKDGIRLEAVTFKYPGATSPALRSVTAHLPAGSVVAIVGEYGSGKTTLAKLLAKFYEPQSGRVSVDGVDLNDINTAAWREGIACAFQDFGRFHVELGEAVGLGDPPFMADEERLWAAARLAQADGLFERVPQGMGAQLGTDFGGVELSEGQWQKVALARASMRQRPLLLIFDEPTASLDAPSERAVYQHHMRRARALGKSTGTITVIISHRFSTVAGADIVLVLEKGKLVEQGPHAELMAGNGSYAELYSIQERAYTLDLGPR